MSRTTHRPTVPLKKKRRMASSLSGGILTRQKVWVNYPPISSPLRSPFFWLHLNELPRYHVSNSPLIYSFFKEKRRARSSSSVGLLT
mmetsp:Transcript_18526/g.33565  ORF Transcript_18526/g.33565 Transcript_18526/m.33565 type:complete len:87 (+) Transcript_18526:344-604(+)